MNTIKVHTILKKVANEHSSLHNICGGEFLRAINDLYITTEGMMDNEVAKSCLQYFADVNNIDWKDAVEYLYYIMAEAFPKFFEDNSVGLDWTTLYAESNDAYGKFLQIKGNEKYASKRLFELFCARANLNVEDCIRESVMDAYGWKRVIKALSMYVIEEYLSVEERYENIDEAANNTEVEDDEIPQSELMDVEETSTEPYESSVSSIGIVEDSKLEAELQDETKTSEINQLSEVLEKYGNKAEKAICIDDDTEQIFRSRKEMSMILEIKYGSITNFYRGQREYCKSKKNGKKYKFERIFPKEQEKTLMVDAKTKEIVKSYKKTTEASQEWGINYDRLQGVLGNKTSDHHIIDGYEWWRESDFYRHYKVA